MKERGENEGEKTAKGKDFFLLSCTDLITKPMRMDRGSLQEFSSASSERSSLSQLHDFFRVYFDVIERRLRVTVTLITE